MRIPEWDIDLADARLSPTSTVRGGRPFPPSSASALVTVPACEGPRARVATTARCGASGQRDPRPHHRGGRARSCAGLSIRDWRALTMRGVAEQAGVNERTVYRYFGNEQGLRDAVMHRLEEQAGIELEGMRLEDVAGIAARIFTHVASYPLRPKPPLDPTLSDASLRQRDALLSCPGRTGRADWSDVERRSAAAVLDVLWSVATYERLTSDWEMDRRAGDRGRYLGDRPGRRRGPQRARAGGLTLADLRHLGSTLADLPADACVTHVRSTSSMTSFERSTSNSLPLARSCASRSMSLSALRLGETNPFVDVRVQILGRVHRDTAAPGGDLGECGPGIRRVRDPPNELLVLQPIDDVGHRGRRDAQGLADPTEGQRGLRVGGQPGEHLVAGEREIVAPHHVLHLVIAAADRSAGWR